MVQKMKKLARHFDVPFIDLVGPLAKSARKSGKFHHNFYWDIESDLYNIDGHQEVVWILAHSNCREISSLFR